MKKVTILVVVFASLVGVGLLGNLITLDIQPFGIFGSLSDLDGSKCSCKDANGDYDPTNCQDFAGVYTDTNGICQTIAPGEDYGNPPSENQGCSANFWAANADTVVSLPVWPIGYGPDNYYNQMFQTTIQFSDLTETIQDDKNEEQNNSPVFDISNSTDENELVKEEIEATGEDTTEETNNEEVETSSVSVTSEDPSIETDSEEVETSSVAEATGEDTTEETNNEEVETSSVSVTSEDSSIETDSEEEKISEDIDMAGDEKDKEKLVVETPVKDENKNGPKLVQALQLKEGKLDLLIRESVAAMLNAAHPQIHYPFTVAEIMKMTQISIASGDYEETMNILKKANGIGNSSLCPSSSLQPIP